MPSPRHTSFDTRHHLDRSFRPSSHTTTTTTRAPGRPWCTNSPPLTIPPRLPLSGLPLRATSVGARTVSTLRTDRGHQITSPQRPALPFAGSYNRLSTGRPGPISTKISCTALSLTGFSLLGLARLTLAPRARAPLGYGHITRFMPSSNATANYHSQSQSHARPRSPPPPPSSRSLASRLDPAPSSSGQFASSSRAFRTAASSIRPSSSSGPSGSSGHHYGDRSVSSSASQASPRKRTATSYPESASHDSDAHEHQHKKMRRHPRRPAKNGRGGGGKPPPPPLQQLEPPLLNREEILRRFPVTLKQQWEENPKAPLANYLGGGSGGAQNLGEGGKGFVVTEGSVNGQKVFR